VEIVAIIRTLAAHRSVVAAGAVLAVLSGLLAAGLISILPPGLGSGRPDSAVALSRVQIDTSRPLVAETRVKGSETIAARSRLFAFLMSDQEVVDGIAKRAGLDPAEVGIANVESETPLEVTPLATEAAATTASREGQVVTVAADPQVPVVSLTATTPDAASATRLVDAASDELVALVERLTPGDGVGHLRAERIGAPVVVVKAGGLWLAGGVVAAVTVFTLWSSLVVLGAGVARKWRRDATAGARGATQQA
jgi:hypothetical protein